MARLSNEKCFEEGSEISYMLPIDARIVHLRTRPTVTHIFWPALPCFGIYQSGRPSLHVRVHAILRGIRDGYNRTLLEYQTFRRYNNAPGIMGMPSSPCTPVDDPAGALEKVIR